MHENTDNQKKTNLPDTDGNAKFAKKTLQDYEVISVIGSGSFGTCFKVREKQTGALYAWKGMDYDELSETQKESLVSEINVLRQLQHPNIVQYYHHLVNHTAKSIFIVMEFCEGGDLAQLITRARAERKRFEEHYIWRVLLQVCRALQMCHNKIQQGTILHRDIKPANIFLDATGNAKLGDFGLARMLRHNECFAQTFVGTPYYMSPELVKGARYDRKSDVWAVGCLVYEMCALRPPFKGHKFQQLSAHISTGKFRTIPEVYSSDLQQIISFMLAVENEQRPSIEIITRHPLVVRNINKLDNEYPRLLESTEGCYVSNNCETRCRLEYSTMNDSNKTMCTEQLSFNDTLTDRRLSVSCVFTPELRAELFYSAKRSIFQKQILQQSDPELYDSIRREQYAKIDDTIKFQSTTFPSPAVEFLEPTQTRKDETQKSPTLFTKSIFDHILRERLHAIRAQESLLKQRSANLDSRECQLNAQEKRLLALERSLHQQATGIEQKTECEAELVFSKSHKPLKEETVLITSARAKPPPIPPRKSAIGHDDSYCSIEPNDVSLLQQPTAAKLNLAALSTRRNPFPTLRKVTFQSPNKFVSYDIEHMKTSRTVINSALKSSNSSDSQHDSKQMRVSASVSSKSSDDSAENSTQRRKSIFSIFGLHRNNKEAAKTKPTATTTASTATKGNLSCCKKDGQVISKCETTELTNIWTKEHKRAAFDLLAAMNAAERYGQNDKNFKTPLTRHKFRQSVRERSTLQRNRLRHSLIVVPPKGVCLAERKF